MSGNVLPTKKRVSGNRIINVEDVSISYTEKYSSFNLQTLVTALKNPTVRGFSSAFVFTVADVPVDVAAVASAPAVAAGSSNATALVPVKKRAPRPKPAVARGGTTPTSTPATTTTTTVAVTKPKGRQRAKQQPAAASGSGGAASSAKAPLRTYTTVTVNNVDEDDAGDDVEDKGDDDDENDDDDDGRGVGNPRGGSGSNANNNNDNETNQQKKNKKQRFCGSTAIKVSDEIKNCEGCQQRNAKSGCLTAVINAGGLSAFVQMGWVKHNDLLTFDMSSGLKYFGRVIQKDHAAYIREVHSDKLYTSPHDWMVSLYLLNNQQLPHQDIKNSCQLDLMTQCYRFVTVSKLDLNLHQLAIGFVHCHCLWRKQNGESVGGQRPIVDKKTGMPGMTISIMELFELFKVNHTSSVSKHDRAVNSALAAEVTGLRKKVHDLQFSLFMTALEHQGNANSLILATAGNAVSSHRVLDTAMESALFKVYNIANGSNSNNNHNNNNNVANYNNNNNINGGNVNYYYGNNNNNNDTSPNQSPMISNGAGVGFADGDGQDGLDSRQLEDSRLLQPYLEPVDNVHFADDLFGFAPNLLTTEDTNNFYRNINDGNKY